MPSQLVVVDEHPLVLTGTIDVNNALQLIHAPDSLSNNNQTLHTYHVNLNNPPNSTIQVRLMDFSQGGVGWQITASHTIGTTMSWTRGTDYAYYSFSAMVDLLEVDVVATSNASPPVTKQRKIWLKAMPKDAMPDRP